MNKQKAAEFLNVSVRAVERYTQQGRLSVTYKPGRTRPVAEYRDAELEALRAEINTNIPSIKQSPKIEFIDANKMGRIFWAVFPRKAQFQRTLAQTNPPMMIPCAFIITCPIRQMLYC